MSAKPPDYDEIERNLWKENASKAPLHLEANDKYILKKIDTFIDGFGYAHSDVSKKILTDPIFAAHFAKVPNRTSFHQKMAAKWLKQLPLVKHFAILPSHGANAWYVSNDGDLRQDKKVGKSLDFRWTTGERHCFAMHKYTKDKGGAQDNQLNEMIALLERFLKCSEKDYVLIVIVDGVYYQGKPLETLAGLTRTKPPESFVTPIEGVPSILKKLKRKRKKP